jgi:hypothetical protein
MNTRWCPPNVATWAGLFSNPNEALSIASLTRPCGAPLDELDLSCCQNPACADHGLRGQGNLRGCFRYGRGRRRRLARRTCQRRLSERKGTALFGARLPHAQARAVLQHPQDGCGARQTARLTGVDKDTVGRYALRAGEHAQDSHDAFVAFSPLPSGDPAG